MSALKYCDAHMCPQPCTTCADDQAWARSEERIRDGMRELESLYKRSKTRRNKALRQVGVLAVELAEIKQHKPTESDEGDA